jgi:hypothetical protein
VLPTLSRSFFNADAPGDDSIFGTDAGRHEDISRNGSSGCGGNAHTAEVAHLGRLLITRRSQQGYALTLRLFNFFFTPRLTLVQKNDTPRMIDEKTLKKSCWRRSSPRWPASSFVQKCIQKIRGSQKTHIPPLGVASSTVVADAAVKVVDSFPGRGVLRRLE